MSDILGQVPRRPTLVEYVVEQLKEYIHVSEIAPGERLPSQDELANRLGVSRNVVREAIKGLEMLGIVESRHGGGVYVTSFDARPIAGSIAFRLEAFEPKQRLEYLFEARECYEIGAVKLMVEGLNADDQAGIEETLAEMRKRSSVEPLESLELDYEFHRRLLDAAGNPVLSWFNQILHELFFLLPRVQRPLVHAPDPKEVADRHEALYLAIRSGDVLKAEEAMKEHIIISKKRWLAFA